MVSKWVRLLDNCDVTMVAAIELTILVREFHTFCSLYSIHWYNELGAHYKTICCKLDI